jgi:hypothetical protein
MESSTVALKAPARERTATTTVAGAVITGSAALAVFWIAYDGGSFDVVSRTSLAVAAWWAITLGVALGIWPRARVVRPALLAAGFLAAFAAWTAASAAWADSAESALLEAARVALYLGIYALATIAGTRATAARWANGIAAGIVAIVVLALAQRFLPGLVELNEFQRLADDIRLAYPLNYWNALAVFAALALPLLLRLAIASHSALVRGGALAPAPAIAAVLYLSSSRVGFLTAAFAAATFVALSGRPWRAAVAALVAGVGGTVAVLVLVGRPALALPDAPAAPGVALLVLALCAGVGVCWALATAAVPAFAVPRPVSWAALTLLAVVAAIGVVQAQPREVFEQFKEPPPPLAREDYVRAHLTTTSGTLRWQLWVAAADQFREAPLRGQGAGSFEAHWLRHGEVAQAVRDAHSLYLETLGELGVVGLGLLLGWFVAALACARNRLFRSGRDERMLPAAACAVLAAFAVAAVFDWMWENTAVAAVAVAVAGLLGRGRADVPPDLPGGRRRMTVLRAWSAVLAAATTAVLAVVLLTHLELRSSQSAAAEQRLADATAAAMRARALAPWAASPHLQLALVREESGDLAAADDSIRSALERDPSDWHLWLVAARLSVKRGEIAEAEQALHRARELNPRSWLLGQR